MNKTKVLVVAHGHPDFAKGGAENAAYRLFQGLNASPDAEAWFVGRTANHGLLHTGTPISVVRDREFQLFAHADHFDFASLDPQALWRDFAELLLRLQPDVVHLHHYMHLGIEIVRVIKRTLPRARVVMTLHEYLALCYNMGQMVKTDGTLCYESSPAACHSCRSEKSPQDYHMRRMYIGAHFDLVDHFVAPSEFLRQRYTKALLDPADITMMWDAGPAGQKAGSRSTPADAVRGRFVFMGQFTPFKGVELLLNAHGMLPKKVQDATRLEIYGTGAHHHPAEFQERLKKALANAHDNVRNCGPYTPAQQASILKSADWVVVPSTWWENAPLVIQEAFYHGRPVICSNIGGMAEKVSDRVSGLHFQAGSAASLADAMLEAVETPGLWESLVRGIPKTVSAEQAAAAHLELYGRVLGKPSRGAVLAP